MEVVLLVLVGLQGDHDLLAEADRLDAVRSAVAPHEDGDLGDVAGGGLLAAGAWPGWSPGW